MSLIASLKQSERTDDTVITTQDHITTYTEDTGIVPAGITRSGFSVVPALDPFPPSEINNALTRSYEIDTFVWAQTAAQEDRVYLAEFPAALFNRPYLQDKLKDYLYFRGRVEVSFRLNTTKFEYGSIVASWLPFYNENLIQPESWRMGNLASSCQCNPVIISAQQGSTVTINIPWIHPEPWMVMDSGLPEIGTLACRVLHPLTSASVDPPANITVTVYARFIEPVVAGYSPDTVPASTLLGRVVTQSDTGAKPANTSNYTRKDVREVFNSKKGPTMQAEAKAKSTSGVISSAIKGVASYAPMVAMVDPGLLPVALMGSFLADTIGPIFSAVGLNKPTDISTTGKSLATLGNGLGHGEGIDYPTKMSLDPECSISTSVGICGYDNPQPTISEIIMRPSLIDTFRFDSTKAVGESVYEVPNMPGGYVSKSNGVVNNIVPTYAAYYGNYHQYWRGGFKYQMKFVTSSFVTTRVRIAWEPEPVTTGINLVSGDLISMVVDITGDTDVEFFVPYLSHRWYTPVHMPHTTDWLEPEYSTGHIKVYLVSPVVSVDTVAQPPVYCSVWQAAAEDFRFFQYTNPIVGPGSMKFDNTVPVPLPRKGKFVTQCDINKEFSRPFKGLVEESMLTPEAALVNGEDSSTLAQLLHRYTVYGVQPPLGEGSVLFPNAPTVDTHYALIAPFLNFRGGKRFFVVQGDTASVAQVGYEIDYEAGAPIFLRSTNALTGGVAYGGAYTAPLAFETAWYEPVLFKETYPTIYVSPQLQRLSFVAPEAPFTLLHSYNDDFSVGVLCATPLFQLPVAYPASDRSIKRVHGWRVKKATKTRK